jgi:HK97 family phage prohead protease
MNIEKRTIAWKGLTLRSADDSGTSTVEGVAVPFGDIIDTWDGAETFDRDCSFEGLDEAKLCFEHGETIGRITKAESTDDGLHITARISDTARGRDAMTLIRDGVLDSFSVGFIPLESQKDRDGITHRRKVRLLETSIVSWPAYQNAKMTKSAAPAVEQRKETMENNNELMDLIQSMQEEQRGIKAEISKMGAKPAPAAIGAAYRSTANTCRPSRERRTGHDRDEGMPRLISTKDTGNTATWIADDLKLIEDRRKVSQLLTHDTLPATGMSMEYHVVTSDTTAVGKQETEGSELSFGKVAFGTKTADINTYGGYTSLSRQTIERSTTPMLNTAITALQNAYAKATEKAVRDHLYAEIKRSATHPLTPTRSTRHSWPT